MAETEKNPEEYPLLIRNTSKSRTFVVTSPPLCNVPTVLLPGDELTPHERFRGDIRIACARRPGDGEAEKPAK